MKAIQLATLFQAVAFSYQALISSRDASPQAPGGTLGGNTVLSNLFGAGGLGGLLGSGIASLNQASRAGTTATSPSIASVLSGLSGSVNLGSLAGTIIPPLKLKGRKEAEPKLREGAKRAQAWYGPYEMKGQGQSKPLAGRISLDPNGQGFVGLVTEGLCSNCTLLSAEVKLSDEDGRVLQPEDGVYVHHILAIDISKPGYLSASRCDYPVIDKSQVAAVKIPVSGFFGTGDDGKNTAIYFTSLDGKFDSGFHLRNDTVLFQSDLVSYRDDTKNVYISVDFEYVEGIQGLDSAPNLLSVTGCKLAEPKVTPGGPALTESLQIPILANGTIVTARGHMHSGGDYMTLSVNGKEVCKSDGVYEKGSLVDMTICDLQMPVKIGDIIEMSSMYDLSKYPLRNDTTGMGHSHDILGGMDVMGMWTMTVAFDPNMP